MRRTLVFALAAGLFLQSSAFAQQNDVPRPNQGRSFWWKMSVLLAASASVADSHSSWGRLELNPMLRSANGRFGMRGVSVKALVTGGAIGAQYILLRRNPKAEKYGILTNMVMAGVLGTAAAANYRMAARQEATSNPPGKY